MGKKIVYIFSSIILICIVKYAKFSVFLKDSYETYTVFFCDSSDEHT